MTPPAATSAGRQTATHARGHRRRLELQPAPRLPRRVSGPARRGASPKRAPRREPLPARAIATLRSLPDHSVLDRIVRGRAWIPLLGVMLAGIVAMQVEVLKLGASIGRSIERGTALQSRNELLRAGVASLADDQRIERIAAGMGMVMPAPDAVTFLSAHPGRDAPQAIANIHAPTPAGFIAALPADISPNGAASATTSATPASTVTAAPSSGAPAQTTPTAAPTAPAITQSQSGGATTSAPTATSATSSPATGAAALPAHTGTGTGG